MSLKEQITTLSSHFEYITLNFPSVTFIHPVQSSGNLVTFKVGLSQPHVREGTTHNTHNIYTFDPKSTPSIKQFPAFPTTESDVQFEVPSPSGNFRALFRKTTDKTILEIWGKKGVIKTFRVSDHHGTIYNDPQFCFQGIRWSADERKLLYIAEKKEEKFPKYFDDFGNDEEASKAFKSFEFKQDLGESYRTKVAPTLFMYDIKEEQLYRIANIPSEIIPTQVSFGDKEGNSLVYCGYKFTDVRFGIKFCYNRDSKIYFLEKIILDRVKEDKTKKLNEEEKKAEKEKIKKDSEENKPTLLSNDDIAIFPILSPDFKRLTYFASPWKSTHTTGFGLKVIDIPQEGFKSQEQYTPRAVLDIVQEKNDHFASVMGYHDLLNKTSFVNGSRYLAFNSAIKHAVGLYIVDLETKELRRIDKPKYQTEEWRLSVVQPGLIFAKFSNVEGANNIAIFEGFNENATSLDEALKNTKWHTHEVKSQETFRNDKNPYKFLSNIGEIQERIIEEHGIESFFFSIKDWKDEQGNVVPNNKKPLMVILHGGPHGNITGTFVATRHYALYKGYNILCPNFTGSTGFGQKFLEDLPTRIGQIDSDEVSAAIKYCVVNGLADSSKIVVAGGSYGGYLPCVMMAKYPELFKCAIIRNPVVSVGYCFEGSDIPEWAFGEIFGRDIEFEVTGEEMKKMYEFSPIGMNKDIKTSILLMLGAKDRRVPHEAGIQYYKALKHKGVDITLLIYPEDEHSLAGNPETETDQFIRMFVYLNEKVPK